MPTRDTNLVLVRYNQVPSIPYFKYTLEIQRVDLGTWSFLGRARGVYRYFDLRLHKCLCLSVCTALPYALVCFACLSYVLVSSAPLCYTLLWGWCLLLWGTIVNGTYGIFKNPCIVSQCVANIIGSLFTMAPPSYTVCWCVADVGNKYRVRLQQHTSML